MAQLISRVLDNPASRRATLLDEAEIMRGTNDKVAERMRYLRDKAKRYGYGIKDGVLGNGRVFLTVTFTSGRIERFEAILD